MLRELSDARLTKLNGMVLTCVVSLSAMARVEQMMRPSASRSSMRHGWRQMLMLPQLLLYLIYPSVCVHFHGLPAGTSEASISDWSSAARLTSDV